MRGVLICSAEVGEAAAAEEAAAEAAEEDEAVALESCSGRT